MTAEVLLMNKEAAALAADSAVTTSEERGEKVFTSANKIFALSKYHPVGVMVYGNAEFLGVPWETVIKSYRKQIGKKVFDTVTEYGENFLNYLIENYQLFPESERKNHFLYNIKRFFALFRAAVLQTIENKIREKGQVKDEEAEILIRNIINSSIEAAERKSLIDWAPKNVTYELKDKYYKEITDIKTSVLENLPVSGEDLALLIELAVNSFTRFPEGEVLDTFSGIAITGFGESEIFPVLESYLVQGLINKTLVYRKDRSFKVTLEQGAYIVPFAQQEMVHTFMEGIDPDYKEVLEKSLNSLFSKYPKEILKNIEEVDEEKKSQYAEMHKQIGLHILKEFNEQLGWFRNFNYVQPVIRVLAGLPKGELANMAETLVNLTSFKRKVTTGKETVGGPVDVALISKGDGLIWVKRKHYFASDLNPQFFANYYEGDINGE